jgi:hypothetical protein
MEISALGILFVVRRELPGRIAGKHVVKGAGTGIAARRRADYPEDIMGVTRSVRDAVRSARARGDGRPGAGGAVVVALGVLLGWLAGRRGAVPPVRATGVGANAPRTREAPPV